VSTSVFQPVFWAGYQIDERHWHMFAMQHYADHGYVGLDATVSPEDGLDFQFTNNSDHPLLIVAGTKDQATSVTLIGTRPSWTVRTDPEVISDVVPAPTQVEQTSSPLFARGRQIILEAAQQGLTSEVVRHVVYPDGHDRTLKLRSNYQPAPTSILVGTG
jgi:vancomycin resistance protein YoaR